MSQHIQHAEEAKGTTTLRSRHHSARRPPIRLVIDIICTAAVFRCCTMARSGCHQHHIVALHCLRDSARTAGHSCLPAANPIDVQSTPCDPFDYVLQAATSVAGSSRSCLPIGPDHRSGPPRGCPDQSGDLLHRPLTVITECTRSWALAVRGA